MQYGIEAGGEQRAVRLVREGDGFAITVNGRAYFVDVVRIDGQQPTALSLIVDNRSTGSAAAETHHRSSRTVTIARASAGRLTVQVESTPVEVLIGRHRQATTGQGAKLEDGPQRIGAPMPGKVVRVLVKVGDAVRARQPLVVVEAMKMENELRAERDGTVAEMSAREGASVEAGALLLVIR